MNNPNSNFNFAPTPPPTYGFDYTNQYKQPSVPTNPYDFSNPMPSLDSYTDPFKNSPTNGPSVAPTALAIDPFSMEGMFGKNGWLTGAAGAISGIAGVYTGIRGLNQSKEAFDFTKDMANRNLSNQAMLTNSQLEDRQNSRLSMTPGSDIYEPVDEYMADHAVDGGAL